MLEMGVNCNIGKNLVLNDNHEAKFSAIISHKYHPALLRRYYRGAKRSLDTNAIIGMLLCLRETINYLAASHRKHQRLRKPWRMVVRLLLLCAGCVFFPACRGPCDLCSDRIWIRHEEQLPGPQMFWVSNAVGFHNFAFRNTIPFG